MQPDDRMTLLFADTLGEHPDTYRFLEAAVEDLTADGADYVRLADGRTIWEVFRDVKFLGSSQIDPCSKILKRDLLDEWRKRHAPNGTMIVGLDWTEMHRVERFQARSGCPVAAPLTETTLTKQDLREWASSRGLPDQRLYELGFPHANCAGACVKAGLSQWSLLHRVAPERFREAEREEAKMQEFLGRGRVTILKRRGKKYSLSELRQDIESQAMLPIDDWGGCGCALD